MLFFLYLYLFDLFNVAIVDVYCVTFNANTVVVNLMKFYLYYIINIIFI